MVWIMSVTDDDQKAYFRYCKSKFSLKKFTTVNLFPIQRLKGGRNASPFSSTQTFWAGFRSFVRFLRRSLAENFAETL